MSTLSQVHGYINHFRNSHLANHRQASINIIVPLQHYFKKYVIQLLLVLSVLYVKQKHCSPSKIMRTEQKRIKFGTVKAHVEER